MRDRRQIIAVEHDGRPVYEISPFGFGIPPVRKPTTVYKLSYLRALGRRAGLIVEPTYVGLQLIVGHTDGLRDIQVAADSVEAFRIINEEIQRQQAELKPIKQPGFKITVTDDEGRLIDEYSASFQSQERQLHPYRIPVEGWLFQTLRAGEAMQRSGRINGMPKLRRCEGARMELSELRRKLYQATHEPFSSTRVGVWALIEQLLKLAEENLR